MNLPEEVLDEILSHLPSDNGRTLRSCSLVSKSWLEPSRRLLFANIIIRRDNYQSWREKIPPTKTGLLHHIRMFTYFLRGDRHSDLCRVHTLRDYLPSFCNLKNLTLCNMTIEQTISENLELFSAFQHTLSSLSLGAISITWSSFVVLVGYFPNLTYLKLLGMLFQVDKRPVARVPHAWRGRLFVDLATRGPVGLPGDLFAELGPEYEELEILGAYEQRLISAVERSLKSLKVNLCNCTSTYFAFYVAPCRSNRLREFFLPSNTHPRSLTLPGAPAANGRHTTTTGARPDAHRLHHLHEL